MQQAYSRRRLLIGAALILGMFGSQVLWNAPSSILFVIIADLGVSLSAGGMMMSVICLLIAGSTLLMNNAGARWQPRLIFLIGLLLMSLGQLLMLWAHSYVGLVLMRVLIGLGIGMLTPVYPMLVMDNFPESERPLVNSFYSACPYLASFFALSVTVPLYYTLNESWRGAMCGMGVMTAAIALMWLLAQKQARSNAAPLRQATAGTPREAPQATAAGALREAARHREVRLLTIADAGDMWNYNFLNSFLPTFFMTEAGMSLGEAARLTSLFPVAGIAAALVCGAAMSKLGLRKPFTWPLHLMIFIGTILAICGSGGWRVAGVILAGFGNAGWAPALFTMPMEFSGFTPLRTGVAYAYIFAVGDIAAFISPLLGGWIGDLVSLKFALLLFNFASLAAAIATFLMKETGRPRWGRPPAAALGPSANETE